jgi:molybdopterin molybdotransferase
MILFEDAYKKVLEHSLKLSDEVIPLKESYGRILAEDVLTDRDFPPFNRSTKDGIAICFDAIEQGITSFAVEGIIAAGSPTQNLEKTSGCVEIMTGAVVPENADTVVMYEEVNIKDGRAVLKNSSVKKGQNIHFRGSDSLKGEIAISKGKKITAAETGILATVGKSNVSVKKHPKISIISTGNELVSVDKKPLPYQIRTSNTISLHCALKAEGIASELLHLADDKKKIISKLENEIINKDVIILSGGVSKGKYDYIPDALNELGVEKIFHRVAQRPGKPFWFGIHKEKNAVVFGFPGNPVSTFVSYHLYFKPWLLTSLNLHIPAHTAILEEDMDSSEKLTVFVPVQASFKEAKLTVKKIRSSGSGDLKSLEMADGFVRLDPSNKVYERGSVVPFIPTRLII